MVSILVSAGQSLAVADKDAGQSSTVGEGSQFLNTISEDSATQPKRHKRKSPASEGAKIKVNSRTVRTKQEVSVETGVVWSICFFLSILSSYFHLGNWKTHYP